VSRSPEDVERQEQFELYKLAIDEYRFQVELNWKRSQYYFVLNAAIIALGANFLRGDMKEDWNVAAWVFGSGLLIVGLSLLAMVTQHQYYRAARDGKTMLETQLNLGELAVRTTPGMGSPRERPLTVRTATLIMLGILGVGDAAGFVYALRKLGFFAVLAACFRG
jgi:hypothetical protein